MIYLNQKHDTTKKYPKHDEVLMPLVVFLNNRIDYQGKKEIIKGYGFTTTGASILSEVEGLSQSIMFWRCFTHWIGGMGVLVFLLAVIPLTGGSNINLMKAESPGPSVGKLVPKIRYTARILYITPTITGMTIRAASIFKTCPRIYLTIELFISMFPAFPI